ncbi:MULTISPECIES: caspase family protein [unclassified Nitrospina]|uniref:WD40 domain-containing protein n=1 Tax=unclassified Nitrospina TaxID=2638683 RepID=UPI003F991CEC
MHHAAFPKIVVAFLFFLFASTPLTSSAEVPRILSGHTAAVQGVVVSPNGKYIISGGDDGTLIIWDARTGDRQKTLSGHSGAVNAVAISPDGRSLATGGADTLVKVWDVESGNEVRSLSGHFDAVTGLAFFPDGTRLVSSGLGESIILWDVRTGQPLRVFGDENDSGPEFVALEPVRSVAASPSGKTLITAQGDALKLWDASTGTRLRTFSRHNGKLFATAFSPDGKSIVSAGQDGVVRLFSTATGELLHTLKGHKGKVNAITFSLDGAHLLSAGDDGTVRLWNAEDAALLHTFEGHTQGATSVAFSPDNRFAVSGSIDKTVRWWDLASHVQPAVVAEAPESKTPLTTETPVPETGPKTPAPTLPVEAPDTDPPDIVITSHEILRGIVVVPALPETFVEGRVTDKSGIARVTVNNRPARVDVSGNFSAGVPLEEGKTKIVVMAEDTRGNLAWETFWVEGEAPVSKERVADKEKSQSGVPGKGHYHALIIGINQYRHLPPLKTAVHDAREVDRILRDQYGFETTLLIDPGRDAIMDAFNGIRLRLTADDHFLIYYAGHGEFDKTVNKAYWLPADARPNSDTKWIIVDNITSNIKRMAARHVLVVADSCYSGTLTRSAITRLSTAEEKRRFLDKMRSRPSRTLMASGGNEPVADGGGGGHSVFARAFIEALQQPENPVFTAEQLFHDQIKERVAGSAQQVPEYNIIKNSGHEGGDFVFIKK